MNKKDIRASIDSIATDSHLKTRLKAKVESYNGRGSVAKKRLALSTVAACAAVVALGVGFGLNMTATENDSVKLSTNYADAQNTNQNAEDFTPTTTERAYLTPEELEEEIRNSQEVIVHPENNMAAVSQPYSPQESSDGKLIVNGNDISPSVYFNFCKAKNYVELPFMAVLNEIADVQITWISDTQADLIINGIEYHLNINNQCTLTEEGTDENIFTPSPYVGDAPYYRMVDNELIIDNTTFAGLINKLGYVIFIDYDTETITIS